MHIFKKNHPLIQRFDQLARDQKDQFIAGFIDGEGSFNVSFRKNKSPTAPKGYLYNIYIGFSLYQLNVYSNVEFLRYINETIFEGVGRIRSENKSKEASTYRLDITGYKNLVSYVLPFLTKEYIVLISKQADYLRFHNVLDIVGRGEHKTREGYLETVKIAYTMNLGGKNRSIPQDQIEKEINDQFDYFDSK